MMNKQPWVEIDEDVYETLHFSALAFGGVGAGLYFNRCHGPLDPAGIPLCLAGHAATADLPSPWCRWWPNRRPIEPVSDAAVRRINERRGRLGGARVPFQALMRELRIRPRRVA